MSDIDNELYIENQRLRAELEQVKSYNEALTQRAVEDAEEIGRLKAELQAKPPKEQSHE